MAEQYPSFQGKEPNIDVNLFVNALTQGIAAGNAQKSTAGAIFSGISKGITSGIETAQGIQQIELNANNLDSEVVAAKKQQEIAKGQKAQLEAKIQANNQAAQEANAEFELNKKRDTSELEAQDASARLNLDKLTKSGNLEQQIFAAQDKQNAGYFSRNPDEAQAYLKALKIQGAPAATIDPLLKQYAEIGYSNRARTAAGVTQTLGEKAAAQDVIDAGHFQNTIAAIPEAQKYLTQPLPEYSKFNYAPSKDVAKNTGTSAYMDLRYGDEIVRPNAILKDNLTTKQKQLDAWVAINTGITGPKPAANPNPEIQPTKIVDQGLGLAAEQKLSKDSIQEKDITLDSRLPNPILKSAVAIGGFPVETVEKNVPAFNAVGKALKTIVASPDPGTNDNQALLKTTIDISAKRIAQTTFDSSPSLQASITMDDVDRFNEGLRQKFSNNKVEILKASDYGKKNDEAFEDLIPIKDPYENFIKSYEVKSPSELYYITNGSGYVKQLTTYANTILKANKAANEVRTKKVARSSILNTIANKPSA